MTVVLFTQEFMNRMLDIVIQLEKQNELKEKELRLRIKQHEELIKLLDENYNKQNDEKLPTVSS